MEIIVKWFLLSGIDSEKSSLMPQVKFEKKFGQSPVFIASTLLEDGGVPEGASSASLLKEAIHVISCGYEDKTEWGKEVMCSYLLITNLSFSRCLFSMDHLFYCSITKT